MLLFKNLNVSDIQCYVESMFDTYSLETAGSINIHVREGTVA